MSEFFWFLQYISLTDNILKCTCFHNNEWFEPGHEKMCLMSYANNKGADQPAHPRSLISAFFISRFYSRNFKTLASFCGCTGWFVSGVIGNSRRHGLLCRGSFVFSVWAAWCFCGSVARSFDFFIWVLTFTVCQDYFTHFEPSQSLGGMKTGDPREKYLTTCKQNSIATRARLEPIAVRWQAIRALNVRGLNQSPTSEALRRPWCQTCI